MLNWFFMGYYLDIGEIEDFTVISKDNGDGSSAETEI